jgi:hypothetical protein
VERWLERGDQRDDEHDHVADEHELDVGRLERPRLGQLIPATVD